MPLLFARSGVLHKLWGGPQVRGQVRAGPPGPALVSLNQRFSATGTGRQGVGRGPGGPPHNKKPRLLLRGGAVELN
jgi:hypothetical protein